MRYHQILREHTDLHFDVTMLGYHHGQADRQLIAKRDGSIVGTITFATFQDEVAIQYISVAEHARGQKIATNMLYHLQDLFPETEIAWGTLTHDGAQLRSTIRFLSVEDPVIAGKVRELAAARAREAELQAKAERLFAEPSEEGRAWLSSVTDEWNDLNTQVDQLDDELRWVTPVKRLMVRP